MINRDPPDTSWKERYVTRLAALFILHGLAEDEAVAVASAHIDERYTSKKNERPEIEAENAFAALRQSKGWK